MNNILTSDIRENIEAIVHAANEAKKKAFSLDEKIRFARLVKEMSKIRHDITLKLYDIDDAISLANSK